MAQEHTPTPWIWRRRKGDSGNLVCLESPNGTVVMGAEEYAGSSWIEFESAADADFILTAVNSYASSQAEIARLREELAGTYDELIDVNGDDMIDSRATRVAKLRAALSEGK